MSAARPPVAVVQGGTSVEREVSLRGARRVRAALDAAGYDARAVDLDYTLVDSLRKLQPLFVYVIAHGGEGEGGGLQGLLETLEMPFTGSSALTSTVCIDKVMTKRMLTRAGIPTPRFHAFSRRLFMEMGAGSALAAVESAFHGPLVVKPARGGSSFGIRVVSEPAQLRPAILGAIAYDDAILIERHVAGRELAVTVLGDIDDPQVLPIVEILGEGKIYDYHAHYEFSGPQLVAAQLDSGTEARIIDVCKQTYRALHCRDIARVDLILDHENQPQVLELNTIPGLTETGPTPVAADLAGMTFGELIATIARRVAGSSRPAARD
jgi:D-alanine-D-alanine ligase